MTEQFLYGADVVTGFEQMGRERMPQRVRRCELCNPRRSKRDSHRALHDLRVQVITPTRAGARIHRQAVGRKHILPGPLPRGAPLPLVQSVRQVDRPEAVLKVLPVQCVRDFQLQFESGPQCRGQHRHAILCALAIPGQNLATQEVEVLHPQACPPSTRIPVP